MRYTLLSCIGLWLLEFIICKEFANTNNNSVKILDWSECQTNSLDTDLLPWCVPCSTLMTHFLPHWCSRLLSDRWRKPADLWLRCCSLVVGLCSYWWAVPLVTYLGPAIQSWRKLSVRRHDLKSSSIPLDHGERAHTWWLHLNREQRHKNNLNQLRKTTDELYQKAAPAPLFHANSFLFFFIQLVPVPFTIQKAKNHGCTRVNILT